jgi:hypothetical protein
MSNTTNEPRNELFSAAARSSYLPPSMYGAWSSLLLPQFVPQTAPQPKIRQLNWQLGELLGLDFGPRGLKKHGRHSACGCPCLLN